MSAAVAELGHLTIGVEPGRRGVYVYAKGILVVPNDESLLPGKGYGCAPAAAAGSGSRSRRKTSASSCGFFFFRFAPRFPLYVPPSIPLYSPSAASCDRSNWQSDPLVTGLVGVLEYTGTDAPDPASDKCRIVHPVSVQRVRCGRSGESRRLLECLLHSAAAPIHPLRHSSWLRRIFESSLPRPFHLLSPPTARRAPLQRSSQGPRHPGRPRAGRSVLDPQSHSRKVGHAAGARSAQWPGAGALRWLQRPRRVLQCGRGGG